MTYDEPMPWMSEPCPYGALGCTCHLGTVATQDCTELRRLIIEYNDVVRSFGNDSYDVHLKQIDRLNVTPRAVDFEVDNPPPKMSFWQRMKLAWRFVW